VTGDGGSLNDGGAGDAADPADGAERAAEVAEVAEGAGADGADPFGLRGLPDPLPVAPLRGAIDAVAEVPGSKSITNRALVCAALAGGRSRLTGALLAEDTLAMVDCLAALGAGITVDPAAGVLDVHGVGGHPGRQGAVLDARMSGTTSRFVAPVAALGGSTVLLDGAPSLRARPMADLLDALAALGAEVEALGEPGHLPVRIGGGRHGLRGGRVAVRGDASSQFLSGLLLSAPAMPDGLEVEVTSELVSVPYVRMTVEVMRGFGAEVDHDAGFRRISVAPARYRGAAHHVEPDASAASYFLAAGALCRGRVRVEGLGSGSVQGDVAFARVLADMGADVRVGAEHIEVAGPAALRGIDVDMADISDVAQTLAVVAPFAEGPTTVRGIGFIRGKETDRIAAVVAELRRLGVDAEEDDDGFTVHPGTPRPGVVRTYDDHRMAMSFAVLGLRAPGIEIADPACVAKTFPGFWTALEHLRGATAEAAVP
jgi:3-phosphoshikimate 1-carboxyvinyltransferase